MPKTLQSKAALSDGRGNMRIDRVEVDPPGPGEVRVRIEASGVCHTDWDFVVRRPPLHVMGHEGAGVVESVGEGVTAYSAGDAVLLNWAMPCGNCLLCTRGYQNIWYGHHRMMELTGEDLPLCQMNYPAPEAALISDRTHHIHIGEGSTDRDTMLHEYGHFIHFKRLGLSLHAGNKSTL